MKENKLSEIIGLKGKTQEELKAKYRELFKGKDSYTWIRKIYLFSGCD